MAKRQSDEIAQICLEHGIHIPSRTILLSGEIDDGNKNKVLLARHLIDAKDETITVELDSAGGDIYDALAIYDCLRNFKGRIEVIGYGKVMSMGAMILQAADDGGRFLMPNATVMIHEGYSEVPLDHPETMQRATKEDKRIRARAYRIIANSMGITQKQYLTDYRFDVFFDALTAVSIGLADKVIGA